MASASAHAMALVVAHESPRPNGARTRCPAGADGQRRWKDRTPPAAGHTGPSCCGPTAMSLGAAHGGASAQAERSGAGRADRYECAGEVCAVCSSQPQSLIRPGRGGAGGGAPWKRLELKGRGALPKLEKKKSWDFQDFLEASPSSFLFFFFIYKRERE